MPCWLRTSHAGTTDGQSHHRVVPAATSELVGVPSRENPRVSNARRTPASVLRCAGGRGGTPARRCFLPQPRTTARAGTGKQKRTGRGCCESEPRRQRLPFRDTHTRARATVVLAPEGRTHTSTHQHHQHQQRQRQTRQQQQQQHRGFSSPKPPPNGGVDAPHRTDRRYKSQPLRRGHRVLVGAIGSGSGSSTAVFRVRNHHQTAAWTHRTNRRFKMPTPFAVDTISCRRYAVGNTVCYSCYYCMYYIYTLKSPFGYYGLLYIY